MNKVSGTICLIIMLGLVSTATTAGELHSSLTARMKTSDPTTFVPIWIRLVSDTEARDLKVNAAATWATRAERHQRVMGELKGEAARQNDLLVELGQLELRNLARQTKGHWIVNVVETELRFSELGRLATRSDIEVIYLQPRIELIPDPPGRDVVATATPQAVGANLIHIKATDAWAAGYDGRGRLICSFDSGVEGNHPALIDNWKGHDGDSAAAWFDPIDQQPFPHTLTGISASHGTRSIGLIVGRDTVSGDTVGVAPGAKWIAAAVMDLPGASFLDGWEWAADPDGNPNTIDDVPDVISHSWGVIGLSCYNIFYDAIDNSEAMGIVNVFASGNEGPTTVRNPADRALDSLDCFAIGNLDHTVTPPVIIGSSSGGPSPCNFAIKPNVVAPGNGVRTTNPTGNYVPFSGTSAATPHVAGLVALLRQKNPDATVDQIKTAILVSTQRADFTPIPNNTYGWGEIDCLAALNALAGPPAQPRVRLFDFTHAPILPGDTVTGTLVLQNLGATASNVTINIDGTNNALTVLDGFASFGSIAPNDTTRSGDEVQVVIADTITVGNILSIDMTITGTDFSTPARLHFLVEPKLSKAIATHNTGRIRFSLSNFGALGMGLESTFPAGGQGFTFDDTTSQDLWEAGIFFGVSPVQVSSAVHSIWWDPDMELKVAPGGNMQLSTSLSEVREQSRAIFNDSLAANPIGLEIIQEGFTHAPPNDDFMTLRYILNNISGSAISGLYFGLHLDWDIVSYVANAGGYDAVDRYVWMAQNAGTLVNYRGVKLIEGSLASAGAASAGAIIYAPPWGAPSDDGYQKNEKYAILTSDMTYADVNKTASDDLFSFLVAGPIDLPIGGTDTVGFAILAGATQAAIADAAARAVDIPTDTPDDPSGGLLPEKFVLHQNYPNPFNPTTRITFDIPKRGEYRLDIINMLGQVVWEQTAVVNAGTVALRWNAEDHASGVYLYRVTVGDQVAARKMLLLK